jgi:hypothetical protein
MHRWYASRPEVETLPVVHVCVELRYEHPYALGFDPAGDTGISALAVAVHRCSCGATVVGDGATAPDDPLSVPPPVADAPPWLPWDEDERWTPPP